jgi:hypothetical protein
MLRIVKLNDDGDDRDVHDNDGHDRDDRDVHDGDGNDGEHDDGNDRRSGVL